MFSIYTKMKVTYQIGFYQDSYWASIHKQVIFLFLLRNSQVGLQDFDVEFWPQVPLHS